jgi:hypothetical protein
MAHEKAWLNDPAAACYAVLRGMCRQARSPGGGPPPLWASTFQCQVCSRLKVNK